MIGYKGLHLSRVDLTVCKNHYMSDCGREITVQLVIHLKFFTSEEHLQQYLFKNVEQS